MKATYHIFTCDICHAEIKDPEDNLWSGGVPVMRRYKGATRVLSPNLDLCRDCLQKAVNVRDTGVASTYQYQLMQETAPVNSYIVQVKRDSNCKEPELYGFTTHRKAVERAKAVIKERIYYEAGELGSVSKHSKETEIALRMQRVQELTTRENEQYFWYRDTEVVIKPFTLN